MSHRQVIHNGRTGANARSTPVIVERKKLPRTAKPSTEPEVFSGLLAIHSHRTDGSDNNILIVRFSRGVSAVERDQIEKGLNYECPELFFNIGWRENGNLRITMKTRTNNCCRDDVLTCVQKVLDAV